MITFYDKNQHRVGEAFSCNFPSVLAVVSFLLELKKDASFALYISKDDMEFALYKIYSDSSDFRVEAKLPALLCNASPCP